MPSIEKAVEALEGLHEVLSILFPFLQIRIDNNTNPLTLLFLVHTLRHIGTI